MFVVRNAELRSRLHVVTHDAESFQKALREVAGQIQMLIYRRETTPIRNWNEVHFDLGLRVAEMVKASADGKKQWRIKLLELAAYALFAAVSDE